MRIRSAESEDAFAVAEVHVRSWQAAYRGLLPDAYLDGILPEDRAGHYDFSAIDPQKPHTLVALDEAKIVGFATTAPSRDEQHPQHGELCALYVDPSHWSRRVGVALIEAARLQLADLGFREALLRLLDGNRRADRFYRLDGWMPDGGRRSDSVWGITVSELRYVRPLFARWSA